MNLRPRFGMGHTGNFTSSVSRGDPDEFSLSQNSISQATCRIPKKVFLICLLTDYQVDM